MSLSSVSQSPLSILAEISLHQPFIIYYKIFILSCRMSMIYSSVQHPYDVQQGGLEGRRVRDELWPCRWREGLEWQRTSIQEYCYFPPTEFLKATRWSTWKFISNDLLHKLIVHRNNTPSIDTTFYFLSTNTLVLLC